jgi:cystathionine beta-lyase/cystathionine gamma-synthase
MFSQMIYVETMANPTCAMLDLDAVVRVAHAAGALAVVDNTFASPINLRSELYTYMHVAT